MIDDVSLQTYINQENMMKKVLLTIAVLLSTGVLADERPIADKTLIAELKQYCTELADEDGTAGKELKVFLLECVNEELDSEGYQPLPKLI